MDIRDKHKAITLLLLTFISISIETTSFGEHLNNGKPKSMRICATSFSGVHVRSGPCTNYSIIRTAKRGDSFNISAFTPIFQCGYHWYAIGNDNHWVAAEFVTQCGGSGVNPFGIGLVNEGTTEELDLSRSLAGNHGWVLLTMAGINSNTIAPQQTWIDSVYTATAHNLSVVVRLGPPWGQSFYRDEADDTTETPRTKFGTLAGAFSAVVKGLLAVMPPNKNLYVQIDNEPDLCDEWFCKKVASPPTPLLGATIAAEYAAFFSQTAALLRGIGDQRLWVAAAPMSPGGNLQCGCCGNQSCGDQDKPGITGLQYMQSMIDAVPDVFDLVDFLASHSYPASGIGHGVNVPFSDAMPGLTYYQKELKIIGRPLQVLMTETGWATSMDGQPPCSEEEKANWTVSAYDSIWCKDDRILGVMPFMLQNIKWGDQKGFEYVKTNGNKVPVFSAVQQSRCMHGFGPCTDKIFS